MSITILMMTEVCLVTVILPHEFIYMRLVVNLKKRISGQYSPQRRRVSSGHTEGSEIVTDATRDCDDLM